MLLALSARRVSRTSSGLSSTRRMTLDCMGCPASGGEGEMEGCAATGRALRPDPAAMPVNDPLDCGEADAGAGKFLRGVKPLEGDEKLVAKLGVETRAVVANKINLSRIGTR